jgi:hypothetical protein
MTKAYQFVCFLRWSKLLLKKKIRPLKPIKTSAGNIQQISLKFDLFRESGAQTHRRGATV